MNQRKIGTILSYVYVLISNGISLIYTPYMLRTIGQSEYGLSGTASSFISYLSLLSFGIGGAYIRFNARYRANGDKEGERRLNGTFLVIFSILSVLVLIGGSVIVVAADVLTKNSFTSKETEKLRVIMILLICNTVATFIFNVVLMALQAYEQFVVIRVTSIVASIVNPIINVIALKMGGRAITLTAISLSISLICYGVYSIYAKKMIDFKFSFKGIKREEVREVFIFSSFLFMNTISDQITNSTDNVVLSAVKGTSAVAVYTVGATFKSYFFTASSTISSVFSAKINQLVALKGKIDVLEELYIRISRIQFYVVSLIFIGYTLLGKDFIILWAGEDYAEAYGIGLILMFSVMIPAFQNIGIEIQKAFNKHKARSIVYLFVAFANVLLTIPFTIWWGAIGAALATLICVWFGQVIWMNWYYQNHIHLNMYKYWKSILSIFPGYIIPIMVGIVFRTFWKIDSLWDILIGAIVISVTFLISVWHVCMNEYEKNLIMEPVKRMGQRKQKD